MKPPRFFQQTITIGGYDGENIEINIDTVEKYDSTIHIAGIQ